MRRGTTPTIVVSTEGIDLTALKDITLTVKQGTTKIVKQKADMDITADSAVVRLTQAETLKLKEGGMVEIQPKFETQAGDVFAPDAVRDAVEGILDEKEMA